MAGGAATIDWGGALSVGGAGWILLDPVEIGGETPGSDLELRVSYGGIRVRADRATQGPVGVWIGVLAGAGNAKLGLPVVETEIAADNFGVLEPELGVRMLLGNRLSLQASLGFRIVFGAENLPGLSPSDLRGMTFTASLVGGPL